MSPPKKTRRARRLVRLRLRKLGYAGNLSDLLAVRRWYDDSELSTWHTTVAALAYGALLGFATAAGDPSVRGLLPADVLLGLLATILPPRIANEEIGDALERLAALSSTKSLRHSFQRSWIVITTVFWVLVSTFREFVRQRR